MDYDFIKTDVLIIGGGIAGCNAAMAAAEAGAAVVVMEKGVIDRSGDVGGGVDHFLAFLESGPSWDTREAFLDHVREAGEGTGDPAIIDAVCCSELKAAIDRMARIGVPLTQPDGTFYRTRSFGQPGPYFINFNGKKLKPALARQVRQAGCRVLDKTMALRLLLKEGRVAGAVGFQIRTGRLAVVQAGAVEISTGDASRLFQSPRVNPFNAWASPFNTGDGQVMAYRAGADLSNVEFMRLSLTPKGFAAAGFNAFMGLGCKLMNGAGEYFMERRDPSGNPPRNAAVWGALEELRAGRGPIYVDCRHLPEEVMAHLYNTLGYDKDTLPDYMAQRGEDLRARPMEIDLSDGSQGGTTSVTGAGIRIDGRSAATVPGLFAAGNCADHNRGLWAATTGGFHAGRQAAEFAKTAARVEIDAEAALDEFADFKAPLDLADGMSFTEFEDTIRKVMYENAGHIRTAQSLNTALAKLERLKAHVAEVKARDMHELMRVHEGRSVLQMSELLVRAALFRRESRMKPFHYRLDHPEQDDANWLGMVHVRMADGKPELSFRKLG